MSGMGAVPDAVQRAAFWNADHAHEVLPDAESPMAATVPSGMVSITVAMIGDKDAGKSTFLRAFCDETGAHFVHLWRLLASVQGTFVNRPFRGSIGVEKSRGDVLLDTDVAQAQVVVPLEEFLFFLEEQGVTWRPAVESDTRLVLLQLVEYGGDHLQRMLEVDGGGAAGQTDDAAYYRASLERVRTCDRVVYWINMETCSGSGGVARLEERLDLLHGGDITSSKSVLFLVCKSRHPKDMCTVQEMVEAHCGKRWAGWKHTRVVAVDHMSSDAQGVISPPRLLDTLGMILEMGHPREEEEAVREEVARVVLEMHPTHPHDWISEGAFAEYVVAHEHTLPIPCVTLLRSFDTAALAMCLSALAHLHPVTLVVGGRQWTLPQHPGGVAIRPYQHQTPLGVFVRSFLYRNTTHSGSVPPPTSIASAVERCGDAQQRNALRDTMRSQEHQIVREWGASPDMPAILRWAALVADWALGMRLLDPHGAAPRCIFPHKLPHCEWSEAMETCCPFGAGDALHQEVVVDMATP